MMPKRSITDVLVDLSRQPDPFVSTLAAALVPAAAHPSADNDVSLKEITERLFALISRQIATEEDPAVVARALSFIDEYIKSQTGHVGPFAHRFSPTASALTTHLENILENERIEKQIAEDAPLDRVEKNVLCAAPSAPLGLLGADLLSDRILGAVLQKKPAKVRLFIPPQPSGTANPFEVFAALLSDLTEQGIALELVLDSTPVAAIDQSDKVN